MTTPEEQQKLADANKAEADARTAQASAERAEQELAEWKSDLARKQREAEATKATAEADKAAREAEVSLDPEIDRKKQEAEADKAIAEARKAVADADRARLTALIPDLTEVPRGETTVTTEQPLFNAVLAHRALGDAAGVVKEKVKDLLGTDGIVLLTSDADLATSDSAHMEVKTGLDQLIAAADKLLSVPKAEGIEPVGVEVPGVETAGVEAGVGAIAAAIPSVLSLLSAHRSISTYTASIDDTAALAAVAGTLSDTKVQLDDFRLVPHGKTTERTRTLQERRSQLLQLKLTLEQTKAENGTRRAAAEERIRDLNTRLDKTPKGQSVERIVEGLKDAKKERDTASRTEKQAAVHVGIVESTLTTIDAFVTRLTTIPSGAKRSPLAAAALREQLHAEKDPKFSQVLLIKAAAGSVAQLLNDRPLWFEDKFSMIGSVSLSYVLIDASTSLVKAAGQASGSASISGSIGKDFSVTSAPF